MTLALALATVHGRGQMNSGRREGEKKIFLVGRRGANGYRPDRDRGKRPGPVGSPSTPRPRDPSTPRSLDLVPNFTERRKTREKQVPIKRREEARRCRRRTRGDRPKDDVNRDDDDKRQRGLRLRLLRSTRPVRAAGNRNVRPAAPRPPPRGRRRRRTSVTSMRQEEVGEKCRCFWNLGGSRGSTDDAPRRPKSVADEGNPNAQILRELIFEWAKFVRVGPARQHVVDPRRM